MNKNLDVLLLARPDHSYTIYKGLLKSRLRFLYCSFKLFPRWAQRFINNPRVRFYGRGYSNCVLLSALHIYRTTFNKRKLERYEKPLYEMHLSMLLPFVRPKVIHYWPNFCLNAIRRYKEKHPETKTFAEVYFPCELWVLDHVKPLLEQKGVLPNMESVEHRAEDVKEVMKFEENFLVPSKFVADTYREYYPDKNYIVRPYGIPRWERYVKKQKKNSNDSIKHFVYAGQITIQKGCDILLEYFIQDKEVELHLYGGVASEQKELFEKYQKAENIHFHGTVPKSQMMEEVSKYDAGIHLSLYDAYSLAVAEMMGAGLPVIISKNTGIFFQVEEIGAGLVTSHEVEDLSAKVNEMRTPEKYNHFVNQLDAYLQSEHKSYEEEMVEFYEEQSQRA